MIYRRANRIEFNHCDPAGIVFYPRYFEMINSVIENFHRDVLVLPFEQLHAKGEAVPTAEITTRFTAPSRLGEVLDWGLEITRLGRSSVGFAITASCVGEQRLACASTLVYVTSAGRPQSWPAPVRARLQSFMETPS